MENNPGRRLSDTRGCRFYTHPYACLKTVVSTLSALSVSNIFFQTGIYTILNLWKNGKLN